MPCIVPSPRCLTCHTYPSTKANIPEPTTTRLVSRKFSKKSTYIPEHTYTYQIPPYLPVHTCSYLVPVRTFVVQASFLMPRTCAYLYIPVSTRYLRTYLYIPRTYVPLWSKPNSSCLVAVHTRTYLHVPHTSVHTCTYLVPAPFLVPRSLCLAPFAPNLPYLPGHKSTVHT
jgi:hypothetical protein